jgi:CRISPR/Cas system-associated endonuclease Cas1
LGEDDFVVGEDGGTLLADPALKRYLSHYEARLTDTVTGDLSSKVVSWRALFRQQGEALREAIVGGGEYTPFVVR